MHKMRNCVTIATVNKNRTIGMHGRANKCYGPLLRSATAAKQIKLTEAQEVDKKFKHY